MQLRIANPIDVSAIYLLLNQMHRETELEVPPIVSETLIGKINEVIHRGVCFVTHNEKELPGAVGGQTGTDWWSDKPYLGDLFFYVLPDHRKSRAAMMLIKEFLKVGRENKIPVRMGHVFSGDIDRKDKFYQHFGFVNAGTIYVEK